MRGDHARCGNEREAFDGRKSRALALGEYYVGKKGQEER